MSEHTSTCTFTAAVEHQHRPSYFLAFIFTGIHGTTQALGAGRTTKVRVARVPGPEL